MPFPLSVENEQEIWDREKNYKFEHTKDYPWKDSAWNRWSGDRNTRKKKPINVYRWKCEPGGTETKNTDASKSTLGWGTGRGGY